MWSGFWERFWDKPGGFLCKIQENAVKMKLFAKAPARGLQTRAGALRHFGQNIGGNAEFERVCQKLVYTEWTKKYPLGARKSCSRFCIM